MNILTKLNPLLSRSFRQAHTLTATQNAIRNGSTFSRPTNYIDSLNKSSKATITTGGSCMRKKLLTLPENVLNVIKHKKGEKEIEITYKITDSEKLDTLSVAIAQSFMNSEPMCASSNFVYENYLALTETFINKRAQDGMMISVENEQNEIIGGIISGDFIRGLRDFVHLADVKPYNHIFRFLTIAEDRFVEYMGGIENLKEGDVCYGFMMGVNKELRGFKDEDGQSIGHHLIRLYEETARKKGYKYLMGEMTNPGSQTIGKASNYQFPIILKYNSDPTFKDIDFGSKAIPEIGNALAVCLKYL